eukprot:scaffold109315_cov18-Tisochrysis_lutea.AAC.1
MGHHLTARVVQKWRQHAAHEPIFCCLNFDLNRNTAARMESTGVPGRIHVSETTQGLLPEYAWESVGLIPVKGKVCESNNELAIFPSSGFHGSPSDDKAESAFDLSLTQSTSVKAKSKHFIRKKKQL